MNDENKIEKLFNDRLNQLDIAPPAKVKEEITSRLIKEGLISGNGNKKGFFILGICILIFLITSAVLFINKSHINNQKNNNHNSITNIKNTADISKIKSINKENINQNNHNNIYSNISTHENNDTLSIASLSNASSSKISSSEKENSNLEFTGYQKRSDQSTRRDKLNKLNNNSNTDLSENDNYINKNNHDDSTPFSKSTANNSQSVAGSSKEISDELNFVHDSDSQVRSAFSTDEEKTSSSVFLSDTNEAASKYLLGVEISDSSSNNSNLQDSLLNSELSSQFKGTNNLDEDYSKTTKIFFDIFAGPQWSFGRSTSNQNNNSAGSNESSHTEINTGLMITVQLKEINLISGINYSNHNSEFSSTYPQHIDTFLINIPVTVKSKFSNFDIPLLVGHSFNTGKFNIEIQTGASITLITNINSTVFDKATQQVIASLNENLFKNNYWNIVVSSSLLYNTSNRLAIFIQPNYKYGLNNIIKNSVFPEERIQSLTLRFGLRIKF